MKGTYNISFDTEARVMNHHLSSSYMELNLALSELCPLKHLRCIHDSLLQTHITYSRFNSLADYGTVKQIKKDFFSFVLLKSAEKAHLTLHH